MVRIEFEKKSTAIYTSHLDLMRCMTRALKRAEIPVKYTEGFNPHPHLVFASPLALGIEAEHEFFEIKLTESMSCNRMKERLNKTLPNGLRILAVTDDARDFNRIEYANYRIFVENKTTEDWDGFRTLPEIPAEKKTKRGVETVDLKEYVEAVCAKNVEHGIELDLTLPCGNRKNISPLLILKTFAPDPAIYRTVCRTGFLTEDRKPF